MAKTARRADPKPTRRTPTRRVDQPALAGAGAAVQWVDDVDFWITKAIHAGSGDTTTAALDKRVHPARVSGAVDSVDPDHRPLGAADASDADGVTDLDLPGATLSEFDGVRYLHLGDTPWVQGAMRLRKPAAIELDYVQRMCVWLLWRAADPALHAVQLGLGAAALTRHAHAVLGLRTTAVELNAQVVQACRAWFKLPPDDERLQVVVADAGVWISAPAQAASIDVLNIDLYDHQAAAPVLDSAEFYAACHAALRPGGFMTVNLFGRKASFARSAARISAAFGAPHCAMVSATAEGNTIAIARKADAGTPALPGLDDTSRADLAERAAQIQQLYKLPATRWLSLLAPLRAPAAGSTARKRPARSTEAVAAPAIATANEPAPVVASPRRSASKARA